jgi:hypothetical protein
MMPWEDPTVKVAVWLSLDRDLSYADAVMALSWLFEQFANGIDAHGMFMLIAESTEAAKQNNGLVRSAKCQGPNPDLAKQTMAGKLIPRPHNDIEKSSAYDHAKSWRRHAKVNRELVTQSRDLSLSKIHSRC